MSEIVLIIIIITGTLTIVAGCLYVSIYMFGRIIKYLGYWDVTMRAVYKVYQDRRGKRQ